MENNDKKFPSLDGTNKNGIELVVDVLNIIKQEMTSESRFIYRGISRDYTPGFIRSGAAVRLDFQHKGKYTYSDYLAYIRTLITEVKQHYPGNYASWRDLEILGDLQHNGAATCLVDFSKNLLVSLWFACGNNAKEEPLCDNKQNDNKQYGVLYYYDVHEDLIKHNNLKIIKESNLSEPIESLLVETKQVTNFCSDTDYSFFMWTPSNLNNRIARQDSVFIFGLPKFAIKDHSVRQILIPSNCKRKIREALKTYFDISDTSIFNDKHGYATVNNKLNSISPSDNKYNIGIDEMLKGNVRTALDFFIMYENEHPKMHEETDDPNLNVKYAELHLSKAICYKNLDGLKYVNNAIREYGEARSLYLKALQNSSSCAKEWKRIYSRKLLRTSNDEISLLYKNQEYYRCIQACDKAIDSINILHNMKEDELRYNRIYCRLSKLELLLLITLGKHDKDKRMEEYQEKRKVYADKWDLYLEDAQKEKPKSDFDSMLIDFFVRIWEGYTCPKDNADFKDSIESFKKEIEDIFMNPTNMELAYSSWDFTEIRDAISKTEDISDDNKVLLQELVAHMISIRDRYNVKELNSNS